MLHAFLAWYSTNREIYVQSNSIVLWGGGIAWSRLSSDCNAELRDSLHSRGWDENEDPALMSSDMQPWLPTSTPGERRGGMALWPSLPPCNTHTHTHLNKTSSLKQRLRHITTPQRCSSTFPTASVCAWSHRSWHFSPSLPPSRSQGGDVIAVCASICADNSRLIKYSN